MAPWHHGSHDAHAHIPRNPATSGKGIAVSSPDHYLSNGASPERLATAEIGRHARPSTSQNVPRQKSGHMFTPESFREEDVSKLHDFIASHSFAILVGSGNDALEATHLPLLLDRDAGAGGCLIGHMARANRQWQQITDKQVLVIFNGPHAYISPTWYQESDVVPTWNYVAVHVYGTFRLIEDKPRALDVLKQYVEFYEASEANPWSVDNAAPDFFEQLAQGTVAFTIEIQRMEGKWKLGQNHSLQRRQRVIQALAERSSPMDRQISRLMAETLPDVK